LIGLSSHLRAESHVLAPESLGDDHAPRSVNAMNLKNMLGQIEANRRDSYPPLARP